jgi:hypothetical protein
MCKFSSAGCLERTEKYASNWPLPVYGFINALVRWEGEKSPIASRRVGCIPFRVLQ